MHIPKISENLKTRILEYKTTLMQDKNSLQREQKRLLSIFDNAKEDFDNNKIESAVTDIKKEILYQKNRESAIKPNIDDYIMQENYKRKHKFTIWLLVGMCTASLLVFIIFISSTARLPIINQGGFKFKKIGDSYCLTKAENISYDAVIPSKVRGLKVTSIGSRAFSNCGLIKSVTLPDGIIDIGEEAFRGCNKLSTITIPNSVITIGGGAFCYCFDLISITIPKSVTAIGNYAFAYCGSKEICYKGTVEEWKSIQKNDYWRRCSKITKVICSDGTVTL